MSINYRILSFPTGAQSLAFDDEENARVIAQAQKDAAEAPLGMTIEEIGAYAYSLFQDWTHLLPEDEGPSAALYGVQFTLTYTKR